MTTIQVLTTQAIDCASQGSWENAKLKNEEILVQDPQNIGALNRLAFCEMQLEQFSKAKEIYQTVLTIERFNPIATKYLTMLKQRVKPAKVVQVNGSGHFIEEPGKTKSVSLQKLADPEVLQATPTATECALIVKNHRVNVVTKAGTYLGSLPDDVAFRLQKLIIAGNLYSVAVQSTSKKSCVVFIKELFKSQTSPFAASFPLASGTRVNSHQEDVLLDEAPLDTRETGNEGEELEHEATEDRDFTE